MPYRMMGWAHVRALRMLQGERGQGTVEYVGIMLLLATVLGAVVVAAGKAGDKGIAAKITGAVSDAIDGVIDKKSK